MEMFFSSFFQGKNSLDEGSRPVEQKLQTRTE